ncbi:MAG: phage tail protein [Synergistaceae bacterium]
MARLALTAVGTVIGAYYGNPQMGFMIGSLAGSYLFPENTNVNVEGPRLGDRTVSSSAYGAPIGINFGTVRTSGNVIWSAGIREQRNSQTVSTGGKGGGTSSQTNITYSYFCSFAVAFGEGIAEDVLRIWADSKLIYDKTGTGNVSNDNINFRFYTGSETQLPDSLIEDDKGAENTPAHRGLCMIVFDDLPLANYGNRIPNITAEITYNREDTQPYIRATNISNPVSSFVVNQLAVDPTREYFYLLSSDGLRKYDMRAMKEMRSILDADMLSTTADGTPNTSFMGIDSQGFIHLAISASNYQPLVKIDPSSMKEVARFGVRAIFGSNSPTGFAGVNHMAEVVTTGLEGPVRFYSFQTLLGDSKVCCLKEDYTFLAGEMPLATGTANLNMVGSGQGCCTGPDGVAYHMTDLGNTLNLYKLTISAGADWKPLDGGDWLQYGTALELLYNITPAMIGSVASGISCNAPLYDVTDGTLSVLVRDTNSKHYYVKLNESGVVFANEIPVSQSYADNAPSGYLQRGYYGFCVGNTTYLINTRDGSYTSQTGWPTDSDGAQYFNDREQSIIIIDRYAGTTYKYFLNRGTGLGVTLGSVVSEIIQRTGLEISDFNVNELTDTVLGYMVSRQMTARSAIQPLAEAFMFDGVEIDYLLNFRKRGRDVELALTGDDLIYIESDKLMDETRTQEVELPEKVSIIYSDKENDYESGTQFDKRTVQPKPTMFSHNQITKEYAIVMEADFALQLASKMLYQSWVERSTYAFRLPWRFLALDPSDVVQLTVDSTIYRNRLISAGIGVDMTLEMEALSDDLATYVSAKTADNGQGFPPQTIVNPVASFLWFLDVPLLRDTDDTGGTFTRDYYVLGAARPDDWTGAFVYRSPDNNSWSEDNRLYHDAQFGYINGALVDPSSPWELDTVSSLEVYMDNGELTSCTYEELMNGANACVINGEVCGFMTAEQDASGYYTLTNWLRAQRGTDYACATHSTGERLIMLNTDSVRTTSNTLDFIGSSMYYKAVSFGMLLESAALTGLTPDGKILKPYSPVQLAAVNDGSDNIDISWVRRTRIGGGLADGTPDIPLAEAFEKYEVDIYVGGSVVRTLQVANTTTVTYTNADQLTDGYSIASGSIEIEVFQISAAVGRGFGRREVLEV